MIIKNQYVDITKAKRIEFVDSVSPYMYIHYFGGEESIKIKMNKDVCKVLEDLSPDRECYVHNYITDLLEQKKQLKEDVSDLLYIIKCHREELDLVTIERLMYEDIKERCEEQG